MRDFAHQHQENRGDFQVSVTTTFTLKSCKALGMTKSEDIPRKTPSKQDFCNILAKINSSLIHSQKQLECRKANAANYKIENGCNAYHISLSAFQNDESEPDFIHSEQ